jgi:hypothetical protein
LQIFKGIEIKKKEIIFKNPEGFAATFIGKIKEILSDHIAAKIEYSLNNDFEEMDLEEVSRLSEISAEGVD